MAMKTYRVPGVAQLGECCAITPQDAAHALALRMARELYGPTAEAPSRFVTMRANGVGCWIVRAAVGPIIDGEVGGSVDFAIEEVGDGEAAG